MAYLTDQELLNRFEYYTLQLDEQLMQGENIDAVVEEIPFGVHFNDKNTLEVIHTNSLHLEITGHHIEEVREMGFEFLEMHVHPETLLYASEVLVPAYKQLNSQDTFLFVQHVRKDIKEEYLPLFTFSKTVDCVEDLVLCLSLQSCDFEKMSPKMEQIVEMDKFKLDHFKQFQQLTSRELEVLKLLANGFNNPAIADKLFISRQTVETHRKSLKRKLEIRSLRDLMKYAFAFNLVEV